MTGKQKPLFDFGIAEPLAKPSTPKPGTPGVDVPFPGPPAPEQANRDCERILARLRVGPCNNVELQNMILGYRQRISDLRKAGYAITNRRLAGRVSVYTLEG